MSPTLTTFLFELVNFLLLAALLGWLLFKPVRASVQARQAADKQQADALASGLADLERRRSELQQREASFDDEMAKARSARLAAADEEATAVVAKAREAAALERDRAARALGQLEPAELERLGAAVAATSQTIVERLLASLDAPDLTTALVGAAARQVRAIDAPTLGDVLIESAAPLSDDDRTAIVAALGDRAAACDVRVVPALGVGLRVTTGRGRIDVSAAGLAAESARLLGQALQPGETDGST